MTKGQVWEIKIDGEPLEAEPTPVGINFYKRGSDLIWLKILWQDIYSAAWEFTRIRVEYDLKTLHKESQHE